MNSFKIIGIQCFGGGFMENRKNLIQSIAIPILVGLVVGLIIMPFMNYQDLQKPLFAPPGFLFPIVWTILYALMGLGYGILKNKGVLDEEAMRIYWLQLGINALWSIFFFVFRWRFFSFIWILILLFSIIQMIRIFYKRDKLAAKLQIPYLIWVIFATYLTLGIYLLNR